MSQKTRSELSHLYDFTCVETFKRHLKHEGIELPKGRLLYEKEVFPIYVLWGYPNNMPKEEKEKLHPNVVAYCERNGLTTPIL
jgi:hypothetical protein